jgi:SM-20-related protein
LIGSSLSTRDSIATAVDAIATLGYAVVPHFVDDSTVAALRSRVLQSDATGLLFPAAIGHESRRLERADIRGDRIQWLDQDSRDEFEQSLYVKLETLRLGVNRALQLGSFDFEGHYAIYSTGRGYARHLDRFRDDDTRTLSIVLYLNDDWRSEDEGALRLYLPSGEQVDVIPEGGTLVAFLADRFAHEVLPAKRDRLSIAGWFRRRRA